MFRLRRGCCQRPQTLVLWVRSIPNSAPRWRNLGSLPLAALLLTLLVSVISVVSVAQVLAQGGMGGTRRPFGMAMALGPLHWKVTVRSRSIVVLL